MRGMPDNTPPIAMPSAPPVAAKKPHRFTHHGITVTDDYAWLRDPGYPEVKDAEVLAHLAAEKLDDRDELFSRVSTPVVFAATTAPPGKSGLCVELTCREGDERWQHAERYTTDIMACERRRLSWADLSPAARRHLAGVALTADRLLALNPCGGGGGGSYTSMTTTTCPSPQVDIGGG